MFGTEKSFSVERIAPRSSATTLSPASASSLLRIPPVQPSPTTTTWTSLSFVTIVSPLAHVRDAERIGGKFLVLVFLDVLAMDSDRAGKADQLPARLVAISAIDRVGEHPLHHGLIEHGPKRSDRQTAFERDLRGREPDQNLLALLLGEPVECFAVGLAAMRVGGLEAGAIKLRRRQRQLIALTRHSEFPWSLHVEPVTLAPCACERPVDVNVDADVGA